MPVKRAYKPTPDTFITWKRTPRKQREKKWKEIERKVDVIRKPRNNQVAPSEQSNRPLQN